jgi:hypothetical protein
MSAQLQTAYHKLFFVRLSLIFTVSKIKFKKLAKYLASQSTLH